MRSLTILASEHVEALSLAFAAEPITASAGARTMAGTLVRYGVPGRTNRGLLRVRPGALRFRDDLRQTILTREHDRESSRGVLAAVYDGPEIMRVQVQAAAGPDGDAALQEAQDGSRAAFSFDVVDATIVGDEITDALVIAIGQVGIPAYDDARIDSIAASNHTGEPMLTEAQRARLVELLAIQSRDAAQESELQSLLTAGGITVPAAAEPAATETPAAAPAAAPAQPSAATETEPATVAASFQTVPAGVPTPATTQPRPSALAQVVTALTAAMQPGVRNAQSISAALADIVHSAHTENIEPVQWSAELWSGLEYEPQFTDLLTPGTLTYWEGKGWRFTSNPKMQAYAGNKAEIPTGNVTTEDSDWEAAREAVGFDIDRKFFDFPNSAFVARLLAKVRESWEERLDVHVKTHILAKAVAANRTITIGRTSGDATITAAAGTFSPADVGAPISGTGIPASTTILSFTNSGSVEMSANASATAGAGTATVNQQESSILKAAARASLTLKRRKVGRASWIYLNDEDLFSLTDIVADKVPAFLDLYGIDPRNFRSSADIPRGQVVAGRKEAGKLLTLPGSPIRVEAQNLANGGIDEAFFGYWAIEEHHPAGFVTVGYQPVGA